MGCSGVVSSQCPSSRVGILVTLVGIELVERFLLIVVESMPPLAAFTRPSMRVVSVANRRESTTLLEADSLNIHTTSITHTVRLTSRSSGRKPYFMSSSLVFAVT